MQRSRRRSRQIGKRYYSGHSYLKLTPHLFYFILHTVYRVCLSTHSRFLIKKVSFPTGIRRPCPSTGIEPTWWFTARPPRSYFDKSIFSLFYGNHILFFQNIFLEMSRDGFSVKIIVIERISFPFVSEQSLF